MADETSLKTTERVYQRFSNGYERGSQYDKE